MAGRGPQTFLKRQKEQARKEKQQEKIAKRLERNQQKAQGTYVEPEDDDMDNPDLDRMDMDKKEGEAGASVG